MAMAVRTGSRASCPPPSCQLTATVLFGAMVAMKSHPRLCIEPRPSRIARGAILVVCIATATLVAALRLPVAVTITCATIVIAVLVSSLWRCTGRGFPVLLHVGIDRRVAVTDRTGRSHEGAILDASYVGSTLTTLVWRAECDRWWQPSRTILFVTDSLTPDEFRRLRVVLRYGRPPGEAVETVMSGTDAG